MNTNEGIAHLEEQLNFWKHKLKNYNKMQRKPRDLKQERYTTGANSHGRAMQRNSSAGKSRNLNFNNPPGHTNFNSGPKSMGRSLYQTESSHNNIYTFNNIQNSIQPVVQLNKTAHGYPKNSYLGKTANGYSTNGHLNKTANVFSTNSHSNNTVNVYPTNDKFNKTYKSNMETKTSSKNNTVKTINIYDLETITNTEKKIINMGKKLMKEKIIIDKNGAVVKEENETSQIIKELNSKQIQKLDENVHRNKSDSKNSSKHDQSVSSSSDSDEEVQKESFKKQNVEVKSMEKGKKEEMIEKMFNNYIHKYDSKISKENKTNEVNLTDYKEEIIEGFIKRLESKETVIDECFVALEKETKMQVSSNHAQKELLVNTSSNLKDCNSINPRLDSFHDYIIEAYEFGFFEKLLKKKEKKDKLKEERNFHKKTNIEMGVVVTKRSSHVESQDQCNQSNLKENCSLDHSHKEQSISLNPASKVDEQSSHHSNKEIVLNNNHLIENTHFESNKTGKNNVHFTETVVEKIECINENKKSNKEQSLKNISEEDVKFENAFDSNREIVHKKQESSHRITKVTESTHTQSAIMKNSLYQSGISSQSSNLQRKYPELNNSRVKKVKLENFNSSNYNTNETQRECISEAPKLNETKQLGNSTIKVTHKSNSRTSEKNGTSSVLDHHKSKNSLFNSHSKSNYTATQNNINILNNESIRSSQNPQMKTSQIRKEEPAVQNSSVYNSVKLHKTIKNDIKEKKRISLMDGFPKMTSGNTSNLWKSNFNSQPSKTERVQINQQNKLDHSVKKPKIMSLGSLLRSTLDESVAILAAERETKSNYNTSITSSARKHQDLHQSVNHHKSHSIFKKKINLSNYNFKKINEISNKSQKSSHQDLSEVKVHNQSLHQSIHESQVIRSSNDRSNWRNTLSESKVLTNENKSNFRKGNKTEYKTTADIYQRKTLERSETRIENGIEIEVRRESIQHRPNLKRKIKLSDYKAKKKA